MTLHRLTAESADKALRARKTALEIMNKPGRLPSAAARRIVEAATVRLAFRPSRKGVFFPRGLGVLVPGGFVLTAAHCVDWSNIDAMAPIGNRLEIVKARTGARFRMALVAAEPVCDIAVLACADNQAFEEDAEAYEQWSTETKPVPLRVQPLRADRPIGVNVLTHHGTWIRARAWSATPGGVVSIKSETPIKSGTSGGSIIDEGGRLVGVVSWSSKTEGAIPVAMLALPGWVVAQIRQAMR